MKLAIHLLLQRARRQHELIVQNGNREQPVVRRLRVEVEADLGLIGPGSNLPRIVVDLHDQVRAFGDQRPDSRGQLRGRRAGHPAPKQAAGHLQQAGTRARRDPRPAPAVVTWIRVLCLELLRKTDLRLIVSQVQQYVMDRLTLAGQYIHGAHVLVLIHDLGKNEAPVPVGTVVTRDG